MTCLSSDNINSKMRDTRIIQTPSGVSTQERHNRPTPRRLFHSGGSLATRSSGGCSTPVPANGMTDIRLGLSCESPKCRTSGRLGSSTFPHYVSWNLLLRTPFSRSSAGDPEINSVLPKQKELIINLVLSWTIRM